VSEAEIRRLEALRDTPANANGEIDAKIVGLRAEQSYSSKGFGPNKQSPTGYVDNSGRPVNSDGSPAK
jgi:hypothetical protein